MGETRVDLLHLLEDLRDAYPGSLESAIVTELVANGLDSGADAISVDVRPETGTVTVVDNGRGMSHGDLQRFHDIAATAKIRGEGIGFAGVGVKLGLLVASGVTTETRSNGRPIATYWRLASRRRAPWDWMSAPGLVRERGTAVQLQVANGLSPLLDEGFVEQVLVKHFAPLLDPAFDALLIKCYPRGVSLAVNGRRLPRSPSSGQTSAAELLIKLPRHHKPAGVGYLLRSEHALAEEHRGVGVSAYGKVILRGWDWLGLSPATPDTITGLIEVPGLAGCLQTNKADFIRGGPTGAKYLRYREAIQRAVAAVLAAWGVDRERDQAQERRTVRPFERDLERVLGSLANDFPLLTALTEKRTGGQYRLPGALASAPDSPVSFAPLPAGQEERSQPTQPPEEVAKGSAPSHLPQPVIVEESAGTKRRRRGRLQIAIRFEDLPGSAEMGRLADAVLWVNQAHPAYRRSLASRSTGYHVALACCLALAPLAAPKGEREFINAFMGRWGKAAG